MRSLHNPGKNTEVSKSSYFYSGQAKIKWCHILYLTASMEKKKYAIDTKGEEAEQIISGRKCIIHIQIRSKKVPILLESELDLEYDGCR